MKEFKSKICPTCGKEFTPKFSSKQGYCDSYKGGAKTCKVYGSKIRTGKMNALGTENNSSTSSVPVVLPSSFEEIIKPLGNEIDSLKRELSEMKKEYKFIYDNMYGDGKHSKNRLNYKADIKKWQPELKNLQRELATATEEDSRTVIERKEESVKVLTESIVEAKKHLDKFNDQFQINSKRREELELIFMVKSIECFRLLEKVCDYIYSLVPNKELITADLNRLLIKYKTHYPFGRFHVDSKNFSFHILGALPQPFFGYITGKPNSGTTRIVVKICADLVKFIGFKILYIGNIEQINNDFKELVYEEIDSNLFSYKACNSKLEITKLIANENYELLVIDPMNYFSIDYNFIYNLQKQHPKLSVLGILKGNSKILERNANVIIDVRTGCGISVKNGYEEVSVIAWGGAEYEMEDDYENEEY